MAAGIGGGIAGLGSNGAGVQQQLRAVQHQAAGHLGKPLIPADGRPDSTKGGREHQKTAVARVEVELLLVAGAVGDMALAVAAQALTVGVDHYQRVEGGLPVALVHAHRNDHAQLAGQIGEAFHRWMIGQGPSQVEVGRILVFAPVRLLEQLGQEHHLGTACRGGAY